MQNSGRFGKPEEIAGLVKFLAVHPAASYYSIQKKTNPSYEPRHAYVQIQQIKDATKIVHEPKMTFLFRVFTEN
uniref:Uncharacterized protein n=1 Tax=Oryza sativa subsp. japonica TaxID=39947 RepID=Q6Z523_ORYSJ|nr:hypothetical protein [Oryza sativa Japonica Group]BAD10160.1 hypothetical protein [Oryza sativa Japonica Group]